MYNHLDYNKNNSAYPNAYDNNSRYNNPINNIEEKPKIFNSYEGFIRGTMFPSAYVPFSRDEPYNLMPKDEKEALLNKIMEYDFAVLDLGLYLDIHPDDEEILKKHQQYVNEGNYLKREYESKYGPLTSDSQFHNTNSWDWIKAPWPWEVK